MKTIVALVDFTDVTFKLLKQAHHLASAFGSEVVLLHVVAPDPVVVDFGMSPTVYRPPSEETIAAENDRLVQLQQSMEKFGVRTSTRQIQGTRVEDLLQECKNLNADIIIVGSHGHGAIYNLLVGSITSQVLKGSPCPVLVVPDDEVERSATGEKDKVA